MPKPIEALNDFVVKFANVNGSGSASANEMFARSILRMGVPIATRNIFPSNIQGLPTWYEVRVSGEGWIGRRGGVDLMVPMNPQTWDKDVASIDPGGYLFYDSTKPLPPSKFRPDINIIGVPLTEMANSRYDNPRDRQLLKNMIYVGALAALLDIDHTVVETLVGEQYAGKDRLIKPNLQALELGRDYVLEHLKGKCGLSVKKSDKVGDRIFIDGNDAAALGAVYGGATVCAWYPITPSTSMAEAFTKHCKRFRVCPETKKNKFAIIQSEDELSAIGSVIGAGWNGARAFTATSGPGISLMQEFLGLSYFAEIPAVIFDIQRGGPSTGMPTRTQQSDLKICAYASHGDTKHVLLLPEDPHESFEFAAQSFDLAERLQTPIFVLLDLDIGMNDWLSAPFKWDDAKVYDRGKVMTAEELDAGREFGRYLDVDGDAIPYRTLPGVNLSTTWDMELTYLDSGPYAGSYAFETNDFFPFYPIDGELYGNGPDEHNFYFTFEIVSQFTYDAAGGQFVRFKGDDDTWLFVNGQLVMDHGGISGSREYFVDFDRLGLTDGETYSLNFFHAERKQPQSQFHLWTNVAIEQEAPSVASVSAIFD